MTTLPIMRSMRFAIIGAGKVGRALTRLLTKQGHQFVEVSSRSPESAQKLAAACGAAAVPIDRMTGDYDWLFITVRDDAIDEVAGRLASMYAVHDTDENKGEHSLDVRVRHVAHTSGVHSAEILAKLRRPGKRFVLAMHPAASVAADAQAWQVLQKAFYTLDGDAEAVDAAGRLIDQCGGSWQVIESAKKPIYHAGAVFASNYIWMLLMQAIDLWTYAGLPEQQAHQALLSLAGTSLDNVARASGPQDWKNTLTGPLVRSDRETLELHIDHLQKLNPANGNAHALYCLLGLAVADKIWGADGLGGTGGIANNLTDKQSEIVHLLQSGLASLTENVNRPDLA